MGPFAGAELPLLAEWLTNHPTCRVIIVPATVSSGEVLDDGYVGLPQPPSKELFSSFLHQHQHLERHQQQQLIMVSNPSLLSLNDALLVSICTSDILLPLSNSEISSLGTATTTTTATTPAMINTGGGGGDLFSRLLDHLLRQQRCFAYVSTNLVLVVILSFPPQNQSTFLPFLLSLQHFPTFIALLPISLPLSRYLLLLASTNPSNV